MNIPQPAEPIDRIPTELEALVQLLVNTFRHSQAAARQAVQGITMASMPKTIINVVTLEGAKLTLTAGDTLVLTLAHIPSKEQIESLTAYASKSLPDGVKVLVLGGGITVAAVTRAIPVIPQPSPGR